MGYHPLGPPRYVFQAPAYYSCHFRLKIRDGRYLTWPSSTIGLIYYPLHPGHLDHPDHPTTKPPILHLTNVVRLEPCPTIARFGLHDDPSSATVGVWRLALLPQRLLPQGVVGVRGNPIPSAAAAIFNRNRQTLNQRH